MPESSQSRRGYQPTDPIEPPPMYAWPSRPLASLRWLVTELLCPWGLMFIAMAVFSWTDLTPPLESMATLEPGWMALIWLRNAGLLALVAGGPHWRLYIRRSQEKRFKFDSRWPTTDNRRILFRDQVKDNMF